MSAEINQVFASDPELHRVHQRSRVHHRDVEKARGSGDKVRLQQVYDAGVSAIFALTLVGSLVSIVACRWFLPSSWGPGAMPMVLLGAAQLIVGFRLAMPIQAIIAHGKILADDAHVDGAKPVDVLSPRMHRGRGLRAFSASSWAISSPRSF